MEKRKLYLPIFFRAIMIFFDLFCLYNLIFFFVSTDEDKNIILFVYGILFSICLPLTILSFVSYTFSKEEIIIKYPFLKMKKCFTKDIMGYVLLENSEDSNFSIYTNQTILSIIVSGKKIRNAVMEFMNEYYEKIKFINMEELKNNGILILKNRWNQIHFYTEYLKLIKKEDIEKYYYKDLKVKYISNNIINFVTKENKKIRFNIWQCRGRIGLFEYFRNYEWKNK
jgi:hypothetical protein